MIMNKLQQISNYFTHLSEQDKFQKRQDALTPGKNPDAFYGDGQLDKLRNLATIKKVVDLKMDSEIGEPVTVEYDPKKNLTDVTISWGNESHTVDFEAGDVIDDHGNEGMDIETSADSDDGRWQFILDVQAEASFPMTGDFADWDFDELIVQSHPDNEDHLEPEDRSDYDFGDELGSAMAKDMTEGAMCEACGKVHEGSCSLQEAFTKRQLQIRAGIIK